MDHETVQLAIVFADISGSTRLYETLGDEVARELVAQCLELMTREVDQHQGSVIKTIGDEIMCTFPSADLGVKAAMAMQEAITGELPVINPHTPVTMKIRVGLHDGPAILEDGDVFGDAVNTAARMAGLAKGGQVITTRETADQLSPALKSSTRYLDRIPVKGKADDIDIFEVIWQPEDLTRIATKLYQKAPPEPDMQLRLNYRGQERIVTADTGTFIIGRGQSAHLVVNDSTASRDHARIECRRGKYTLTDQSTNGTHVLTHDGPVYLRREQITLHEQGKIALGRDFDEATEIVIFAVESAHPDQVPHPDGIPEPAIEADDQDTQRSN